MNICIPLQKTISELPSNYEQLKLASHFGVAGAFVVINTGTQQLLGLCKISKNCSGPCQCAIPDLSNYEIDAFVGPAMGFRLAQIARRTSKRVYTTQAPTLQDVLVQFMQKDGVAMSTPKGKCFSRMY